MQILTNNKTDMFTYWWNISGELVEEPNLRRGGQSGVIRFIDDKNQTFYVKRQENHIYRSLFHPFGQSTISREYKSYQRFIRANIKTPELVFYGKRGNKAILVTKALDSFTDLESWLVGLGDRKQRQSEVATVLKSIARALANMHLNRLQHNCVYPKHIFIKTDDLAAGHDHVEVAFIDLEKSRLRITTKQAALHDTPQIKRHTLLLNNEWDYFVTHYEQAFGKRLPTLKTY